MLRGCKWKIREKSSVGWLSEEGGSAFAEVRFLWDRQAKNSEPWGRAAGLGPPPAAGLLQHLSLPPGLPHRLHLRFPAPRVLRVHPRQQPAWLRELHLGLRAVGLCPAKQHHVQVGAPSHLGFWLLPPPSQQVFRSAQRPSARSRLSACFPEVLIPGFAQHMPMGWGRAGGVGASNLPW